MTTSKQYDLLNRLTAIQSSAGLSPAGSSAYAYNLANQRTALTNADNAYWIYTYDTLGQVTSGRKYWANGTPVAGPAIRLHLRQHRQPPTFASGGNQFGTSLRQQTYAANNSTSDVNEFMNDGQFLGNEPILSRMKSQRNQTGQRRPDGAVVTNAFLANGLMQKTWGSRLYPVEYTFDYAGRMRTMTTWQQFNQSSGSGVSGSATTTWNYDTARGWLTNKTYADRFESCNSCPKYFPSPPKPA
jgi:hypothetical protein